jgi:hypothetical protein
MLPSSLICSWRSPRLKVYSWSSLRLRTQVPVVPEPAQVKAVIQPPGHNPAQGNAQDGAGGNVANHQVQVPNVNTPNIPQAAKKSAPNVQASHPAPAGVVSRV